MFKYLSKVIKDLQGEILTIGVDEKVLTYFSKNNSVNVFTLDKIGQEKKKAKKLKNNKGKIINIKRLKKYFKRKSIDYIICDYITIKDYQKYVIRDLVAINSKKIYLYCNDFDNIELINKRFSRYNTDIIKHEFKQYVVFEINTINSKNNWFFNKLYYFSDTLYNLSELISNILTS